MSLETILFEQALMQAIEFAKFHSKELGSEVLLVRNLHGRIQIALESSPKDENTRTIHDELAKEFTKSLQKYAPNQVFLYRDELFAPDAIFDSPDRHRFEDSNICVVDRQVTNLDWLREPLPQTTKIPRATLFGIKGGVGRSTALAVWAWYLATKYDKKVLIFDLDLESPGISGMLLPNEYLPKYGIVDWFVESALDQGDKVLGDMIGESPLGKGGRGWVRIVPAAGSEEKDYLAKLSRIYLDLNLDGQNQTFANRLSVLIGQLEQQEQPDIILFDSRAGLHDIAAIAITRLKAMNFLFAINTPQTWQAYRFLFSHWQRWGQKNLLKFRNDLKIVAGMVPEVGITDYLERCRQSAYNLFIETLYEEEDDDGTLPNDTFNFSIDSSEAPHYPLKILWNRAFTEFNPIENPEVFDSNLVQAMYGSFAEEATQLVFGEKL